MSCYIWLCENIQQFCFVDHPSSLSMAFEEDVVWVVPTQGYAHYLSLVDTMMYGVSFPPPTYFPAQFLWRLVQARVGETPDTVPLDIHRMALLIIFLFQHHDPAVEALSDFYRRADDTAQYQLAVSLAHLFERYRTYRPDWLIQWGKGDWPTSLPDEYQWQRILWCRLAHLLQISVDRHPIVDWIDYTRQHRPPGIPERVILFFLPSVVPLYWSAFSALSRWCRVEAWFLSAADMYCRGLSPEEMKKTPGAFLHQAWGRQKEDLIDILLQSDEDPVWEEASAVRPQQKTVLVQIQNHIRTFDCPHIRDALPDESLSVVACADFLSELKTCKSWLIALLQDRDKQIAPSDILVWLPDLSGAQNHVHAIFGDPHTGILPYQLSGLPVFQQNADQFFLSILSLLKTRFTWDDVWSFCHQTGLLREWGWSARMIEDMARLLRSVDIAWGIDGAHVARYGGDGCDRYTWIGGVTALYVSLCFDPSTPFYESHVLSDQRVHMEYVPLLDQLYYFLMSLRDWYHWPDRVQLLSVWLSDASRFLSLLARYTYVDCEKISVRLREVYEKAPDVSLSYDAFVLLCQECCAVSNPAVSPQSAVLCAPFGTLRGLPYRVIVCLGMQKSLLPMKEEIAEYDLLRRSPRWGDRYTSDEQKAAFLDGLLQAEYFYCSYHYDPVYGEQARSFLIDDLCFFLSAFMQKEVSGWAEASLFFSESLSVSPSVETVVPSVCHPVSSDGCWSVSSLSRILSSPARFFLQRTAGIHLPRRYDRIEMHEPTDLSRRHYERLMAWCQYQDVVTYQSLCQHPLVPSLTDISAFWSDWLQYHVCLSCLESRSVGRADWYHLYQSQGRARVYGVLRDTYDCGSYEVCYVHLVPPGLTPRQKLALWIRHVWASTARCVVTCVSDAKAALILPSLTFEEATAQMEIFFALAEAACQSMVPFYVNTSYTYTQYLATHTEEEAIKKAEVVWSGDRYRRGEKLLPECSWAGIASDVFASPEALGWGEQMWSLFHRCAVTMHFPVSEHSWFDALEKNGLRKWREIA